MRKESRYSDDEYTQRRHSHRNDENFDSRNSRRNFYSDNSCKNEPINQQLSCLKSGVLILFKCYLTTKNKKRLFKLGVQLEIFQNVKTHLLEEIRN